METEGILTTRVFVLFALCALGQVGGSLLLSRTEGFTSPVWTALCLLVYGASLWALAALVREGGPLSMIMPTLAATVPLTLILIGVLFLGESASWARVGLLSLSCIIIGVSATL